MGWTPDQVRACTMSDFALAWDGFVASKGSSEPDAPDLEDAEYVRKYLAARPALLEDA